MADSPDIRSVLDPLPVDQAVKAQAWDHFNGASSPDDFKQRFDTLAIPQEAKAALWNMKFNPGAAAPAPAPAPAAPPGAPPAAPPAVPPVNNAGIQGPSQFTGPLARPDDPTSRLPTPQEAMQSASAWAKQQADIAQFGAPPVPKPPLPPGLDKNVFIDPSLTPPSQQNDFTDAGQQKGLRAFDDKYLAGWGNKVFPKLPATAEPEDMATNAVGRAILNVLSPESLVQMAAISSGAEALPVLANMPGVAEKLKNLPALLKALDVASTQAVPVAVAGKTGYDMVAAGKPKDLQDAIETGTNALMAGASLLYAVKAGRDVLKSYPDAQPVSPADTALAQKTGGIAGGVSTPEAQATAQTLSEGGRNLAASQWEQIAKGNPIDLGGGRELQFGGLRGRAADPATGKVSGRPYYRVVDKTGKVLVGGTQDMVSGWIDQQRITRPESLLTGTAGGGLDFESDASGTTITPSEIPKVSSIGRARQVAEKPAGEVAPAETEGAPAPAEAPKEGGAAPSATAPESPGGAPIAAVSPGGRVETTFANGEETAKPDAEAPKPRTHESLVQEYTDEGLQPTASIAATPAEIHQGAAIAVEDYNAKHPEMPAAPVPGDKVDDKTTEEETAGSSGGQQAGPSAPAGGPADRQADGQADDAARPPDESGGVGATDAVRAAGAEQQPQLGGEQVDPKTAKQIADLEKMIASIQGKPKLAGSPVGRLRLGQLQKTLAGLKAPASAPSVPAKAPVTPQLPPPDAPAGTKYVLPGFVTHQYTGKKAEPAPSNEDMAKTLDALQARDDEQRPADEEPPELGPPLAFKAGHHIEWDDGGKTKHGTITSKTGNMYQVQLPDRGGSTLVPATESKAWNVRKYVDANADQRMTARIRTAIDNNEDIRLNLEKLAEKNYGGTRASGAFDKQKLYELQETAMNQWLADNGPRLLKGDFDKSAAEIRGKMALQATQTVRSDEKIRKQQFSTPSQIAYLADRALAAGKSDRVLEPSAGTGTLVAALRDVVHHVHVNEIDPERAKLAGEVGFKNQSQHDGEIIHALLDQKVQPTRVIMNPPFSSSALKNSGNATVKGKSKYGHNHLISALQRLAPGGRLVAILGGGTELHKDQGASLTAPTTTKLFQDLAKQYHLRANVRIAGKEYAKNGTTFGTRVLVIDKTGATPGANWLEQLATIERGDYGTVEDAFRALVRTGIADVGPRAAGEAPAGAVSAGDSQAAGQQKPGDGLEGDRDVVNPGSRRGTRSGGEASGTQAAPAGRTAARPERPPNPAGVDAQHDGGEQPESRPAEHSQTAAAPDSGSPILSGDESGTRVPLDVKPAPIPAKAPEAEDSGAFVTYHPRVAGNAHSGSIVESKSMATVALPPFTYKPSLPPNVDISAIQMESVIIAGQQNERLNPDGSRAAALIGDGTGVGKGRTVAAILSDNWNKGRRRMLWVSKSWPLEAAAREDLAAVGAADLSKGMLPLNKLHKSGKPITHEGVIFTTYDLLNVKDAKAMTLVQNWLKGSDEGDTAYTAWDESHTMKNTVPAGRAKASQIGKRTLAMRTAMPKLRQVFLSATAATDVINFGYLERLGNWGANTPFPRGFPQFVAEIGEGGVAAMEMIARELKAVGKYIARTLSYHGVNYETVTHSLNPDQKRLYRDAAKAWRDVTVEIEKGIKTINGGKDARVAFMNQFWGAHQRFFNQLITALKLPTALELADKALADGKSPVITLVNTNEAGQNTPGSETEGG